MVQFVSYDGLDILDFQGNIIKVSLEEFLNLEIQPKLMVSELTNFKEEKEADYVEKIQKVIDFVKAKDLSKLVISRRKLVDFKFEKIRKLAQKNTLKK